MGRGIPYPLTHGRSLAGHTVDGSRDTLGAGRAGSARPLVDLLDELRKDLVQVPDDPEVGHLEDRGVRVLVHRDDRLGGLHAGPVLDGSGDAARDVQLWRDRLPRLPDLVFMRVVLQIRCPTGRPDSGTELVGE